MNLRPILAIARKDALDILLNKSSLMALVTPLLMAVLYAVLNGVFGGRTTELLIYNPGGSAIEQVLSGSFGNPNVTRAASADEVASAFGPDGAERETRYAAGLAVPANFEVALRAGEHPQLAFFVNGEELSNAGDHQLLARALTDYARSVAQPEPPVSVALATVNPPKPRAIQQDLSTFYATLGLLGSFMVGFTLVPGLLVEEKERKTLRMLMVSPASFADVVAGKLVVGLGYQLLLSGVVLAIQRGLTGQVSLVLAFALLGAAFGLALGLLAGSLFQTTSAMGAFIGLVGFIFIIPAIFVGPIGSAFQGNPVAQAMKLFPTYYLADGIFQAMQAQATLGAALLNGGIVLACTVALFAAAVWTLNRQAAVAGTL